MKRRTKVTFIDVRSNALAMIRNNEAGMPGVDEIGKIRRAHFREGRLINGISSGLAVSRATVRKALRYGETAFAFERTRQPCRKIGLATGALRDICGECGSSEA